MGGLGGGVGHPAPGTARGSSSVTRSPFGARRSSSIATAAPLNPPPIMTTCSSALIGNPPLEAEKHIHLPLSWR